LGGRGAARDIERPTSTPYTVSSHEDADSILLRSSGHQGGSAHCQLTARCGIHFNPTVDLQALQLIQGESAMNVTVEDMPELRLATVPHSGPYNRISEAFQKLAAIAGPAGLFRPDAMMIALYHDDPETTPAAQLRSDAGLTVPDNLQLPAATVEKSLPAGRYARATHIGPYATLPDAWSRLLGEWLPGSGLRVGKGVSFELYRNDPTNTPPEQLRTDLYIPVT